MTLDVSQLRFPHWVDLDRWNRHQAHIFNEICERFDEGNKLVILDDPCGGGKSLIAAMVRQYLDVPGYYLVGTKALQDQLERTLALPVIKGRANYTPNGVDITGDWRDPTCADCDYDSKRDLCSYCTRPDACPYSSAKDVAAGDDLPCANYSYALGEWTAHRSQFRNRGLVICDESDTIPDELMSFVSVDISPRQQQRLELSPPTRKTVESSWPQWFDYAIPHIENARGAIKGRGLEPNRRRATLDRLLDRLKFVSDNIDGWVYEYDNDYISFKPVKVDTLAPKYLWEHGERFLCMTGSGGSPEQFVEDTGFDGAWKPVFAASTFPVERRPIYLCPTARMTKKTEIEEWPKMARAVLEIVDMHPDAKILVHTVSYKLTKYLLHMYADHFYYDGSPNTPQDRRVFAYGGGDEKNAAIAAFENLPNAVLLAPSLDRGYDNPDIDICVICKVPSPYLGSKQVNKRLREHVDGETWYANQTIQTLVQMYGRVMRSEDDEGQVIVLDSMFDSFHGRWQRFFPAHFNEAIDRNSDIRFELRMRMKKSRVLS